MNKFRARWKTFGSILLALWLIALCSIPEANAQRRGRQACAETLAQCDRDGCGGDSLLNARKNLTTAANNPEAWSLSQIIALNEESPESWSRGKERDELEEIGEGTPVVTKGYLIDAFVTKTPESTNCFLKGESNNDYHLNLVRKRNLDKSVSVVAEITPRFRPAGWTIAKLQALADTQTYVRVTGWLMFDSAHPKPGNHRATAWEIHPVTKFEVCTATKAKCDRGTGWKKLENVQ